jgi:hypothetical protein
MEHRTLSAAALTTAAQIWMVSRAHISVMRCLQLSPPRSSGRVPRKPDSCKSMTHQVGHSEEQLHILVPFGGHSLLPPGSQRKSTKSGPAADGSFLSYQQERESTEGRRKAGEVRRAGRGMCEHTQVCVPCVDARARAHACARA